MQKPRTHYDNLMVARTASAEVIRAAYKSLTQKYHPDKNPGDPQAARIMAMINQAYEVLSDPQRRRSHDEWIAQQEQAFQQAQFEQFQRQAGRAHTQPPPPPPPKTPPPPPPQQRQSAPPLAWGALLGNLFRTARWIGALGFALVLGLSYLDSYGQRHSAYVPPSAPAPTTTSATPSSPLLPTATPAASRTAPAAPPVPRCQPMPQDPKGRAWPRTAGYVRGFGIPYNAGYSQISIDNSQGNSALYIKLGPATSRSGTLERHAFVPAGQKFTLRQISPGTYYVKYKDIASGCNFRSSLLQVEQFSTATGYQYSDISLTLYKVLHGNMRVESLSEADF
ncbi:DnaJ domain-containing protein [Pseudomonas nitroreducens]|uniref:DnaJ domain-containing protein n=1 Tax=Pseudomonas nitroreducens TaxID=46680 RepID=UPI0020A0D01C|nr:DnaJ domain-containing protein [Pseudomonas nitroreducens]MCP1621508.1 hypothetical protein [Pseudomonas nitroreducens]